MKTTLKMKMNSKIKTTSKVKTTENLKIRNICLPLQMFSVQHPLKKIVSHTKMENDLQFNWTQWTLQLLFGYRTCFRKIDTIEINLVCNHSHSPQKSGNISFWKTAQGSLVTAQQATDSPKQPKPTKPRPKNLEHIQNSSNQAAEQPKPTKPRPKNLAIYHFRRQL